MINTHPVYCDVTELVLNPILTGIQRVVREVIRNWDGERRLQLCYFDSGRGQLVELPAQVGRYLVASDATGPELSFSELRDALADILANDKRGEVPSDATVLIPEVFFDEQRCRHHMWRLAHHPDKIHVLFYDFIPWLEPDIIGVQRSHPLMWYLSLAQQTARAAFISEASKRDWISRILRDEQRDGTVLPLGADGLQMDRQHFDKRKRDFVALGSIDGRKNQVSIMRAFQKLWAEGADVGLTLVGRVFDAETAVRSELELCAENDNFRHVERATDAEVREILSGARATIYASTSEGYGLPPVESLYAGIPCIASKRIPSVAPLSRGVRFLDEASPAEIAEQVSALMDDREAEKAWREAGALQLATWKDFGSEVSTWVGNS